MRNLKIVIPKQEFFILASTEQIHTILGHRDGEVLGEFFSQLKVDDVLSQPFLGDDLTHIESSFLVHYHEKIDRYQSTIYLDVRLTPAFAQVSGESVVEKLEYFYMTGLIEISGGRNNLVYLTDVIRDEANILKNI